MSLNERAISDKYFSVLLKQAGFEPAYNREVSFAYGIFQISRSNGETGTGLRVPGVEPGSGLLRKPPQSGAKYPISTTSLIHLILFFEIYWNDIGS